MISTLRNVISPRNVSELKLSSGFDETLATIAHHVIHTCMGDTRFEEPFLEVLKTSLPVMKDTIIELRDHPISIRLTSEIAMRCGVEPPMLCKRKINDPHRICFETAFIMVFMLVSDNSKFVCVSLERFLERYPEFKPLSKIEQYVLLAYRNVMVTALRIVPGAGHKNHLLDLCTRILEGHQQKYVTGSGENNGTKFRVLIYRRESGVLPTKKMCKGYREMMTMQGEDVGLDGLCADAQLLKKRKRLNSPSSISSSSPRGYDGIDSGEEDDDDDGDNESECDAVGALMSLSKSSADLAMTC